MATAECRMFTQTEVWTPVSCWWPVPVELHPSDPASMQHTTQPSVTWPCQRLFHNAQRTTAGLLHEWCITFRMMVLKTVGGCKHQTESFTEWQLPVGDVYSSKLSGRTADLGDGGSERWPLVYVETRCKTKTVTSLDPHYVWLWWSCDRAAFTRHSFSNPPGMKTVHGCSKI